MQIQELIDENSGEDGLLDDVIEVKRINKNNLKSVKSRLKK